MTRSHGSFGRLDREPQAVLDAETGIALLKSGRAGAGALLGYGNGRSYGDTCLNPDGAVVDMRSLDRIVSFDPSTGLIEVEAGVLLSAITAHAAPHGYFPPVVPGTQFVTVGGAIANDVHGKNHHRRGAFGCHVERFRLLRSDGRVHVCSAARNPALFAATIGGLGLTGLILDATLRLMPVGSLNIAETVAPFRHLSEYFDLVEATDRANEYAVAWIDQLGWRRSGGRGVLLAGNHADDGDFTVGKTGGALRIFAEPPFNVLNRPFLRVFNSAYRFAKSRKRSTISTCQGFFFPLDGVRDWNRLYGPHGLHQHQSVVPLEVARRVIPDLFSAAERAGEGSFLTVLKRFGSARSPGLMSFPRPGYTLTLDFPNRGERTRTLLDRLDEIVIGAGGGVNPYKDARMSAAVFAASFPHWAQFDALRDPAFGSGFWRRTGAELSARCMMLGAAE